ncbi:nucleotide exchange factor GrpE [Labrys sp. La1]|uniref:nucleotide exchange factor GrpE n=1 Tax=Labrys sp. La1 TaxID=3404917 RepID=UPI003EC03364
MTRRAKPENDIHGAPEPTNAPGPTAKATEQSDPSPAGSADDAAAIIARLEADNAALKDRLLRALAETENVRRRAERELNDARQYAVAKFAGDMLGVADNIERAIANVPAQVREGDEAVRTLIEGVELTEKELLRSLERHGVRKLDPLGERFDPNFHEALFEVLDPSVPSGTVSKVIGAGYSIGTRSLRPARVGVSSGGPRQPAESGVGRQP